jgi:2-polyprenyl-3-methyl-5-hydroxy-6-metoxy-1,4-benzoquinol methylase
MKPEVRKKLNTINREFYRKFAQAFSEMRSDDAYEIRQIPSYITPGSQVLDIGCGNGRLGIRLVREDEHTTYVGIDSCEELLSIARQSAALELDPSDASRVIFKRVDITDSRWIEEARTPPSADRFDVILLIAVLHHVPGNDERTRILSQARDLLFPNGKIILSAWQFPESVRMRQKIVPWSTVEIDENELKAGDSLLVWKRGGIGYRYCHWIDEGELEKLARASGLSIVETFRSGGYEGNLSLYAVLTPGNPDPV